MIVLRWASLKYILILMGRCRYGNRPDFLTLDRIGFLARCLITQ